LRIFSIVDNLHDFICRGIKNATQALGNVQDYNMTKIFTAQCGVPQKGGKFKEIKNEVQIIVNVCNDIFLYNYIDILLRKNKMNILRNEIERAQMPGGAA
jgi:hypothetical protein